MQNRTTTANGFAFASPVHATVGQPASLSARPPDLPTQLPRGGGDQLPTLAEWNARYIEYVLGCTKGKKTAAARILGINRRTLYRRKKSDSVEPGH